MRRPLSGSHLRGLVLWTGFRAGLGKFDEPPVRDLPENIALQSVNDGKGLPGVEAQREGLVRRTWAANPRTEMSAT